MHRFLSRSDESTDLTRRAIEAPANVLYGTLRRLTERNTGRADDFVAAVENLCIIRARGIGRAPVVAKAVREKCLVVSPSINLIVFTEGDT